MTEKSEHEKFMEKVTEERLQALHKFIQNVQNPRDKKHAISYLYEIGMFTTGDVERAFLDNGLEWKGD